MQGRQSGLFRAPKAARVGRAWKGYLAARTWYPVSGRSSWRGGARGDRGRRTSWVVVVVAVIVDVRCMLYALWFVLVASARIAPPPLPRRYGPFLGKWSLPGRGGGPWKRFGEADGNVIGVREGVWFQRRNRKEGRKKGGDAYVLLQGSPRLEQP
ncbi:uncharacterized protein B0I36DRAFT_315790 [Microdochium trichocladiopsis]|uniref:Uncharacterized protein n=1 Tax=Microdochium trichocladiopsis TaxID=1682393 RepID=A0A9P8YFU6_9PEZI|nr:uncharacterized protein B0I36DRAFT_315790 [Microdochium trichocladiopsis]KAH7038211.1 hypothetical protein B0I36DRAFT_315790 [Microdochium trichocladiopsis]